MTTLTIEISEKAGKTIADLVEQLGGKVLSVDVMPKTQTPKLSRKETDFLKGFDEAIEFVNNYPKGRSTPKTIDELMDEL